MAQFLTTMALQPVSDMDQIQARAILYPTIYRFIGLKVLTLVKNEHIEIFCVHPIYAVLKIDY
jgi:hypothetical protein